LTGGRSFDKVNHSLLIHKLRYYEIDGKTTRWIQNWLEDRQQTVVLYGISSEAVSVDSGVHQGSVQGPGLFLFYVSLCISRLWFTLSKALPKSIISMSVF
jgi:hypothetical protein